MIKIIKRSSNIGEKKKKNRCPFKQLMHLGSNPSVNNLLENTFHESARRLSRALIRAFYELMSVDDSVYSLCLHDPPSRVPPPPSLFIIETLYRVQKNE